MNPRGGAAGNEREAPAARGSRRRRRSGPTRSWQPSWELVDRLLAEVVELEPLDADAPEQAGAAGQRLDQRLPGHRSGAARVEVEKRLGEAGADDVGIAGVCSLL